MFKSMTAVIATLSLACAMCLSMAAPAMAMKSGQAVLACASNLKCNDYMTPTGEHVMCVKGGGCVLCPADPQANCVVAMRLHSGQITTDPAKVLMENVTPAAPAGPASSTTGSSHAKGGGVILY